MHSQAELISLALTVAGVIWAFEVIRFWLPEALTAYRSKTKTPSQWLVLGIVVSFVGSIVDNTYWGVAWTAAFFDHPAQVWLFHNGVFSNVPFRQIPLVAASMLHALGAVVHTQDPEIKNKEMSRFKAGIWFSLAAGLLTYLVLLFFKMRM